MDSSAEERIFMNRCLELARMGKGKTGTNPMVGAVVVHKGRIIGEGYHHLFGGPHAEVLALNSVKNKELLKEASLYVNLEPCSHFGKTPPCSLMIKDLGIPRVFVGSVDPNPMVAGKGISFLKENGIKVKTDVLKKECLHFNRKYFTQVKKNRPYIILKWAESRDGFLDLLRSTEAPVQPTWITSFTARKLVHKWRGEEDGILAGVNTIIRDDPELNVRNWTGKQPHRISIDRKARISTNHKIVNGKQPTTIFTEDGGKQNMPFYQIIEKGIKLDQLLSLVYDKGIGSIIVEGGAMALKSFIESGLWDEARVFKGTVTFNEGVKAPSLPVLPDEKISFGNSFLFVSFNKINSLKVI